MAISRWVGVVGPLVWIISLLSLGSIYPGYSHVVNLVSELGAKGARTAGIANIGLFFVPGVLQLLHGVGTNRKLLALSALSRIVAGAFPCDELCQGSSKTQVVHSLAALASGWLLSAAAFMAWTEGSVPANFRRISLFCCVISFLSPFAIGLARPMGFAGAVQRIGLISLQSWLAAAALVQKK